MANENPGAGKGGQLYEAAAEVHAGGRARFEAHGLAAEFDGTSGRLSDLPGPADLLCAALSACILKNVERFSHMMPFRYEKATVRITAERQEPPPVIVRMHYELEVRTDEPADRVDLLHRNIQKFGTITNTLGRACEVSGTIRAFPPGSPS